VLDEELVLDEEDAEPEDEPEPFVDVEAAGFESDDFAPEEGVDAPDDAGELLDDEPRLSLR
jgi:hypothetical protein